MVVKDYLQLVSDIFSISHRYANPDSALCNYCKGATDVIQCILNDLPNEALSLEMSTEE